MRGRPSLAAERPAPLRTLPTRGLGAVPGFEYFAGPSSRLGVRRHSQPGKDMLKVSLHGFTGQARAAAAYWRPELPLPDLGGVLKSRRRIRPWETE
jgi:hypothetical protein